MKKFSCILLLSTVVSIQTTIAQAEKFSTARPDGVAPIGVMTDHFHHKGHWMLSYRFMPMWMSGYMDGKDDISSSDVMKNYKIATNEAQMYMHMLGVMYAPSHKINIMAMGNYVQHEMHTNENIHHEEKMTLKGLGDVSILGMYKALDVKRQSIHLLFGFSNILAGEMSSESIDPTLGFNYLIQRNNFTFGLQSLYIHRLAENEELKMGNSYNATTWAAAKISTKLSLSARLKYNTTMKIQNEEDEHADMHGMHNMHDMPIEHSINHSEISGREKLDLSIGGNFKITEGQLKNVRIGIEVGLPIYQKVDGLQMKDSYFGTLGFIYPM